MSAFFIGIILFVVIVIGVLAYFIIKATKPKQ
jgi:hypothetical protein